MNDGAACCRLAFLRDAEASKALERLGSPLYWLLDMLALYADEQTDRGDKPTFVGLERGGNLVPQAQ